MRVRSAPPQESSTACAWLDPDPEELTDLEEDVATQPRPRPLARSLAAGTLSGEGGDPARTRADQLAAGTGQFAVPRSRRALRGSPDDPISMVMTRRVVCARPE